MAEQRVGSLEIASCPLFSRVFMVKTEDQLAQLLGHSLDLTLQYHLQEDQNTGNKVTFTSISTESLIKLIAPHSDNGIKELTIKDKSKRQLTINNGQ